MQYYCALCAMLNSVAHSLPFFFLGILWSPSTNPSDDGGTSNGGTSNWWNAGMSCCKVHG